MLIQSIEADNFKSFDHLSVRLNDYNVFIGSNASGKSNFVELFQFLRDIDDAGLENAVSMHGGGEYLLNASLGADRPLRVCITYIPPREANHRSDIAYDDVTHCFTLEFASDSTTFHVIHEELSIACRLPDTEETRPETLLLQRKKHRLHISKRPAGPIGQALDRVLQPYLEDQEIAPNELAVERVWLPFMHRPRSLPGSIATYDFDPRLAKRSVPVTGKVELERDGENLALVLRRILADPDAKQTLTNIVSDALPFVTDIAAEKYAERSLLLSLRETFSAGKYIPSSNISDGSIHMIALLVALYFTDRHFIAIEEPERNIHPALIARVNQYLVEATQQKQIVATTHSPEMLRHLRVENLYLVSRDEHGFSRITKPADARAVHVFLANEVGLDDLLVQDLFGVGE